MCKWVPTAPKFFGRFAAKVGAAIGQRGAVEWKTGLVIWAASRGSFLPGRKIQLFIPARVCVTDTVTVHGARSESSTDRKQD